jgi:hypothetical protein
VDLSKIKVLLSHRYAIGDVWVPEKTPEKLLKKRERGERRAKMTSISDPVASLCLVEALLRALPRVETDKVLAGVCPESRITQLLGAT